MKTINERRSIRTFTDKEVEIEKIEMLLRAGMQAPSARNQMPWEFVVVRDKDLINGIASMGPNAKPVENSKVTIALLVNNDVLTMPSKAMQDMGACAQNILLEAVELNLGAVWIGVMPDEERMEVVKNTLNLPDNVSPFCVIAIGYSDNEYKFIDRYDATRVHYEKY